MAEPKRNWKVWARHSAYSFILIAIGIGLVLYKGNPQWSMYIYLFQKNVLKDRRFITGFGHDIEPGIRDGCWRDWYDDGVLAYERNYVNGRKHGIQTRWYENGNLFSRVKYNNGVKQGWLLQWHLDGSIRDKVFFIDGKLFGSWIKRETVGEPLVISSYYIDTRKVTEKQYIEARKKNPALPPPVSEAELKKMDLERVGNKAPMTDDE